VQTIVKFRWQLMLFAALVAAAGPVCAQSTEAGRFLSVVGDVRVGREGGQQRAAQRAAEFYEGESIVTGSGALAQLRMSDGALMSVRGETEIKLDRFSYSGENDRNASFFMSVLKGGLRTITGVIGKQNRDRYRITTATVTLGVRGTDFEIVHVPQAISSEVPAGTYNRVYEGVTSFQNKAGAALLVSRDQTAFVALQGSTAPVLVPPPAAIFSRPTPIPQIAPQGLRQDDGKVDKASAAVRSGPAVTPIDAPRAVSPALATPIDAPRTLSPTLLTPLDTPRTLSPALLTPIDTSPILTAPATTLTPVLTAPTTTLTPIDTTKALTPTTTLSPATTIVSPAVTPVLTAPTTTLTPVLTAPTTTLTPVQTAPAVTPVLTAPAVTPVLTAPIQTAPKILAPIIPIGR
jgi:hypothetical protein